MLRRPIETPPALPDILVTVLNFLTLKYLP